MGKIKITADTLEEIAAQIRKCNSEINTEMDKLELLIDKLGEISESNDLLAEKYRNYVSQYCASVKWLRNFSDLNESLSAELVQSAERINGILSSCGNGWSSLP